MPKGGKVMFNRIKLVHLLGIAVVAVLLISGCSSQPAASSGGVVVGGESALAVRAASEPQRSLSVTGTGTATAAPDIAYVQLGVDVKSASPAEASAENAQRMDAIMAAVKELGIAEKDVRTTTFSIFAEEQMDSEGKPTGQTLYHVVNKVQITVRELDKVGALLEKAIQAGANSIDGVSFGLADPEALQREARSKAMADAQKRAQQLAEGLGVKLGQPQQISEWGGEIPAPRAAYGIGGGAMVEKA
ncbi:MAG: SIMPL domain-containing protein, partial [Chloroflexi bacterium]|nr:SIMPL domain-containing protein [Chloroflexota bacterium]